MPKHGKELAFDMHTLQIPDSDHPAYKALVTGSFSGELECFALKMMLGRMQVSVRFDPSPENVGKHIAALHEFFLANRIVARRDITKVFDN
jgi:hypothetical protein